MHRRTRRFAGTLCSAALIVTLTAALIGVEASSAKASDEDAPLVAATRQARAEPAKAGAKIKVYPVPTSSAGLGRITTAPNGDMWFTEEDGYRIGQIRPNGSITEWTLPADTTTDEANVIDIDVAADGKVWAIIDSGWKAIGFYPGHPETGTTYVGLGAYPYGKSIRVGADGVTPWVTMRFDDDGIAYISDDGAHWPANAPECDGSLGRGSDGHIWCVQFDNIIRVATDGNSGVTAPLPDDATYPNSLAAGPKGAIWVARDDQGTWVTSPGDGSIGWVNADTTSHFIRLGSRVAPRSLTRQGNTMWFTSVGAAKGIGHINAQGVGALTKVGNYHPTSLTIGKDGAIWFTDTDHNVIVRVPRSALQATNVDLGTGSKLRPPKAKRKLTISQKKKGAKRVFTGRSTSSWPACRAGNLQIRRVKGHSSVVVAKGKAGKAGKYKVKVKPGKMRPGRYFTKIVKRTATGTVCTAATSRKVKIKRP